MSATDWMVIPDRLQDAGFAVCYTRVCYDPERPLWSAKASRNGREWSTMGENLCEAFRELERQTREADGKDWRKIISHEVTETRFTTKTA
ncbi:MAG: hypothetical protein ABI318_15825 [Chthoniobacteraceae bacterium]